MKIQLILWSQKNRLRQVLTVCLMTAVYSFGRTQANVAIQGKDSSFLLQTASDKIIRHRPGRPPELFYFAPGKIVEPVAELTNGTVWIVCKNKGKGGELIALDTQLRPIRVILYYSDDLYGSGAWGENAIHYITSDSFWVVNETSVLVRKSLKEMYRPYHFADMAAAEGPHPFYLQWWFLLAFISTLVCGGILFIKKRRTDSLLQQIEPLDIAVPQHISIERAIEVFPDPGNDNVQTSQYSQDMDFLNKVREIILTQLDNTELDGKTMGKITGLSPSQLHRKLTAITGLPTGRYIHQTRMQEAKKLLEQKSLTIAEIAYMTGFSDPAYFTRLFTKTFGSPPRAFRN